MRARKFMAIAAATASIGPVSAALMSTGAGSVACTTDHLPG